MRGIILIVSGCINLVAVSSSTADSRSSEGMDYSDGLDPKVKLLDSSKYLTLEEQYKFLKSIAKRSKSVQLKVVGDTKIKGKSFSNDIYSISIGDDKDPVMFFDCGIHAREWISPATCLYLIQKLAHVFEVFKKYKGTINSKKAIFTVFNFQWVFIPNVNPDGYMKTHSGDPEGESTHRMHRKNRRPQGAMEITEELETQCDDEGNCEGVDLNRNLPGGWGLGSKSFLESSGKPWNSDYKGPHALSEPESKALHKLVTKLRDRILLAVSIHSYGKDIYYPKGYLPTDHPDQIQGEAKDFLRDFADAFNEALKFRVGSVSELLDAEEMCGGATDDYYYSTQKINLTYTIELDPDLDDHHVGFKLPASKIEKVGHKMWKALKLMARKMTQIYPQFRKKY